MGKKTELPSPQQVEAERARLRYRRRYRSTLRSTLSILVVAAAAAILVADRRLMVADQWAVTDMIVKAAGE